VPPRWRTSTAATVAAPSATSPATSTRPAGSGPKPHRRKDAERYLTEVEAAKLEGTWVDPAHGRVRFVSDDREGPLRVESYGRSEVGIQNPVSPSTRSRLTVATPRGERTTQPDYTTASCVPASAGDDVL